MNSNYVIGLDYGTDSVRAVIIDTADGKQIASSVFEYPRWKAGLYCDPSASRYRQHPLDYLEGVEATVRACVKEVGAQIAAAIRAICVDTTGSTPVAVDRNGTPLSLLPGFEEDPDAMFMLWKDHTSIPETERINELAKRSKVDYLKYVGGIYSSEWFWAKIFNVMRHNEAVAGAAFTWVEHCDWMPFVLTGGKDVSKIKRGVCAAGHKGLYSSEWGGYPPAEFFVALHPALGRIVSTLPSKCYPADTAAGTLSKEWAAKLGLGTDVVVAVGAIDAHLGAVGGTIKPGQMSMVIGTSTCDMLVVPAEEVAKAGLVPGICGSVQNSIVPGMVGMEAGQSAFGDVYAWFFNLLNWPFTVIDDSKVGKEVRERIIAELNKQAAALETIPGSEIALDWFNGRRTPDADQSVKGALWNLTLGSDAPRIFRALVESTCFGTKAIVERFTTHNIRVDEIVALGGISQKSPFVMQMLADVLEMPIAVSRSEQTCALGSAMVAATAAGIYPNVETAMEHMGQGFATTYLPDPTKSTLYRQRYEQYRRMGETL